ncbi:class I SAM-dependent methyltransferase [Nocardioides cynanchi]|uniref:class I SAM-dependent methyltransferase n=1 Tax=Nocardioides cynanchi TaxID=2558918 RepID=UPI001782281F|nr:methyltransferase domain-containing protein [Nocardioides cynanchi]
MSSAAAFDENQRAWADYTATPWARIRYAVVRKTLAATLAGLGPGPARILDVGGGDALDSLPLAASGHDVTVLDPSQQMLSSARDRAAAAGVRVRLLEGGIELLPELEPFDVVLCHFVLQYRDDLAEDLARLVAVTRPGGVLSVIAPNPASAVVTRLLRDGPAAALAELGRDTVHTVTFDRDVRKLSFAAVEEQLSSLGCPVVGRYGGRIANDLLTDDDQKLDPAFYADLERLELALCDQEPFWRTGAFWQLVARTPQTGSTASARRTASA